MDKGKKLTTTDGVPCITKKNILSIQTNANTYLAKTLVIYQNVTGLGNKLKNFFVLLACCFSDIICVTESELTENIADRKIVDNSCKIFCKDRNSDTCNTTRGSGVFIAKQCVVAELIEVKSVI